MALDLIAVDLTTEVVRTARLVLRPFRPDDVDAVHVACQSPDIARWISSVGVPYTREDAEAFVLGEAPGERRAGRALTVAIEADGALVGASGVHRIGQHPLGPEVGYWIAPEGRGHGYAAEAAHALADWAIGLGAPRVYLVADVLNTGAHRPEGRLQPGGRAALVPPLPGRQQRRRRPVLPAARRLTPSRGRRRAASRPPRCGGRLAGARSAVGQTVAGCRSPAAPAIAIAAADAAPFPGSTGVPRRIRP
jgi:RimJ/RimL family protein N-acetyltransferase